MLVCNVSLLVRHATVTASLAESANAADVPGIGGAAFAVMVDEPASALDTVDASLGQIILEAASAASTVDAGLIYAAMIVEAAFATELSSASVVGIQVGTVAEVASAADVVDSLKISGTRFEGVLALDGPITPAASQPTLILIEG